MNEAITNAIATKNRIFLVWWPDEKPNNDFIPIINQPIYLVVGRRKRVNLGRTL